jgi:hypothetical protein
MIQYFIMLLETIDSLFRQYGIAVLTTIKYKFLQDGKKELLVFIIKDKTFNM